MILRISWHFFTKKIERNNPSIQGGRVPANTKRIGGESMDGVTVQQLMTTGYVILAVFAAIITVDKVIDIFRKWKAPSTDTAKKLANDKILLDEHSQSIEELKESTQVLCNGVLALLDHELHNGNADQMQSARDDILKYLQGKI